TARNSPLSVYSVHEQIPRIVPHLMRKTAGKCIRLFANLAGQPASNSRLKTDALSSSGETEPPTDPASYLALFGNQPKTCQTSAPYFPQQTASYLSFAISNQDRFQKDLHALLEVRKELPALQTQLAAIKKSKNISFEEDIRPVFGGEFAVVEQS